MNYTPDFTSRFRILKGGKISLVVSAFLAGTTLCFASPSGGVVSSGTASIAQNGTTTTINQSTNKASINWQNFSIGKSESVTFNQPNASAITLNRVVGNEKSIIDGALNANGQVWILNSNGVLFSKNAKINTSGLLATTKALSDEDFQNGNYSFKGDSTASVINLGTIEIANGGYASLLANTVQNEGTIKAIKGTVTLTGASEATINLNGNSLVSLKVDKGVLDALVENKGAIIADGGDIYLTTNAVNELLRGVVNNTGIIEANSLDDITGKIELFAHGGTTNVSGTLEATKGFIETSGESLHVSRDVSIKAKEWLLDPSTITIQNGGGSDIAGSTMDADTVTTVLNGGTNVTLSATSDITVDEAIMWSAATQLKLSSSDTIHINATIKNTNTTNGGVYFNAANTTNKVIFGASGKVIVYNPYQLQWLSRALNGKYELGGNIDASGTASWNSSAGFVPIGDDITKFGGTFDGKGYTIDGLTINRSDTYYVGLFGYTANGSTVKNIGLTDATITGDYFVGGLVGGNYGTITNSYAMGSVNGETGFYVGGLVGGNYGTITNSYATGSVSGLQYVGGLVGLNYTGSISNSYATGSVSGDTIGGLVGENYSGSISNSYATGSVNGDYEAGGLVGTNQGTITNSYATGSVIGTDSVGGLVGLNGGTITNSYATGSVSGSGDVGGLLGYNGSGSITNSYWDIDTTGQTVVGNNDGGVLTNVVGIHSTTGTIKAFTQTAYTGFDFTNTWYMIDGQTRPFLRSEYSTTITNDHQLQLMAMNLNATYTLTNNITYAGNMWSSAGFVPIGNNSTRFGGTFDGKGYTIDGLTIYRLYTDYVGLFGVATNGSTIQNIGLTNAMITGDDAVGGLVGYNQGTITNSYATGSVSGDTSVGGLVGENTMGIISNSYATGSVSGNDAVGGLVGYNNGSITNSYATGSVSGNTNVGGLVGLNGGTITDSYWDIDTTHQATSSGGGTGIYSTTHTIDAFTKTTYAGFDFDTVWVIYEGHTYPLLRSFLTPLTITISSASKTYDGTAYSGGFSYSTSATPNATLLGSINYTDVTTYTNAGSYTISDSGFYSNQQGYLISYVNGTLTIDKASLSITANTQTKTYGDINPTLTYQITSGSIVHGDTLSGSLSTMATQYSNVGDYAISSTLSNGNYAITYTPSDLTITARPITLAANTQTKTYGDVNPTLTYQITSGSIVHGDTLSGSLSTMATQYSNVGDYAISSTLSNGNYAITYTPSDLTITARPITLTADSQTKTYGDVNPTLTYQITNGSIVHGDTLSGSLSTTATQYSNVGDYAISSTLSNGNYAITYTPSDLTITARPITLTADSQTKTYGDVNPTLTYQITSGSIVHGDTLSGSLSTTATQYSNIGDYAISSTLSNGNYAITYTPSDLTITARPITLTADSQTKTYGDVNPTLTYQITSGSIVHGDTLSGSLSTTATQYSNVGDYAISSTLSNGNYAITYTPSDLTITKAPLIVTANNASKIYNGLAYSGGNGITYSGFVNSETASILGGSLSYGGTSQSATNAGSYTISPSGLSASNYDITYIDGLLTIKAASNPNITHIKNGTATHLPIFILSPMQDTLTQEADTETLQKIAYSPSAHTIRTPLWAHSLIQLLNGGMLLPEGLELEYN